MAHRSRPAPPEPGGHRDVGPDADPDDVARTIALQQLGFGPRTRAQLEQVMARRNVPEESVRRLLERFCEVGLVDDAAYASAWVESRHTGRGLARRALAHELRHRGVPDPLVDQALDELDSDRELATARALVARRLPATRSLEPAARVRRLTGLLARKGYPGGLSYRVVREALAGEGLAAEGLAEDQLAGLDTAEPD
ncbi:MAG TPA: regulatory protein RecX [Actinomycetes bacterium]